MTQIVEGSKVINIVDSKISKEENHKSRIASAVLSLKAQLLQQLAKQQFLNAKQLEELALELERQALIHKNEEDLQRWLQNEIERMQRNFEAMQALQSEPSAVAQVEDAEVQQALSQHVTHVAALRAEFEELSAAMEPELAAIGTGLSAAKASLAAVSTLPEEERVKGLINLGRDVDAIYLKVGKAQVKVDDLFKRVEAAKAKTEDVMSVLEKDLELEKENVFASEELEALNHTFEDFLHSTDVQDLIDSLFQYKTQLKTYDDHIQTINLTMRGQVPSHQISVFENQFGFFYSDSRKNNPFTTPLLKPALGGRSKDEDELLKAVRKYSL